MRVRFLAALSFGWFLALLFAVAPASAQFNASIQGVVTDPSGAAVAQAKINLENVSTHVTATTTSDTEGNYRFISLAPGNYKVSVEASGFARTETTVTLETGQNLSVPISLKVGATTEFVEVTGENPLFNTAETRNQMTLETQELGTLPLAGRNMLSLTTLAPGVSGLGLSGGPGVQVRHRSPAQRHLPGVDQEHPGLPRPVAGGRSVTNKLSGEIPKVLKTDGSGKNRGTYTSSFSPGYFSVRPDCLLMAPSGMTLGMRVQSGSTNPVFVLCS